MNTSFEIIEPPVCDVAQKKHGRQTFSSYVFRRMPLAAASLSVAMTVTSMNCIDMQRQYHPVFIGIESIQNDLSVALGNDYEAQAKLLQKLNALKSSLQSNWNGEDDLPIEELSFNNTRVALSGAFSYAAYVSDDNQISGKEPFSINAFKSALTQIHRILGYV